MRLFDAHLRGPVAPRLGMLQRLTWMMVGITSRFRTSRSAFGPPPFSGDDRVDGDGVELVDEVA